MGESETTGEMIVPVGDFSVVMEDLLGIIDQTIQINDETGANFANSLTAVDKFISQNSTFSGHKPEKLDDVENELCGPTRGTSFSLLGCGGRVRMLFRQPRGSKNTLIGSIINPRVDSLKEKLEVETISGRFKDL